MLNRLVAPAFHKATGLNIKKTDRAVFSNGTVCYYLKNSQQPVIKLELVYAAGKWHEQHNDAAYMMGKMLEEGTANYTSSEIKSHIDRYGAFFECLPGYDRITLSISCLSKHFEDIVPLLAEMAHLPTFPEKELETLKQIRSQQLAIDQTKNSVVASKKLREILFGAHHPYGRTVLVDDVAQISHVQLQEHFQRHMQGKPLTVFLGGDLTDRHFNLLEKHFGQTSFQNGQEAATFSLDTQKGHVTETREDALQSSIRIGKQTIQKRHSDYIPLLFVNEALGGYFGSRLMKNIREEKGLTYGIYSTILHLKHYSYLVIGTDVNCENTEEAISEIHKEIEVLKTTPMDEDELETVKNYMAGSFQAQINSTFSLMEKFKDVHFNEVGYAYYDRLFSEIEAMDAERLMATANQYLGDGFTEVVVGKRI